MCLLILAEYLYILDQWGDGVNGLAVSGKVVIGDIDIEEILPLMTDDRKTLYLGEVYVIEGENGEDLAQTALLVRKREDEAGLVGFLQRTLERCLLRIACYEEACEVVFIVLYAVLQDFHTIHPGGTRVANSSLTVELVLSYELCSTGSVLSLYSLQIGMSGKKLTALHEGHRVRMDLTDRIPVVIRQTADAVLYVELMLSDDSSARHSKQFIIVKETTSYRILYCQHRYNGRIILHALEHLLKGLTAYKLQLLSLEILVCGNVVETAQFSLYGYSLHILY